PRRRAGRRALGNAARPDDDRLVLERLSRRLFSRARVLVVAFFLALLALFLLHPGLRAFVVDVSGRLARGDIEGIRDVCAAYGALAAVISALLMVFQSLAVPLPAFPITVANGLLFGPVFGTLLSWSSAMAAAALSYGLARLLGRPAVVEIFGES